ncbi:hypothetical protein BKA70DRAFT_1410058 [Coprinopsis sp. MPI-PUGE-AT-0042]|nr:hypothetical protein BKA70DRAFT_1410058 [Coprinopsis sp. MPI-PUGE-AT-0042]
MLSFGQRAESRLPTSHRHTNSVTQPLTVTIRVDTHRFFDTGDTLRQVSGMISTTLGSIDLTKILSNTARCVEHGILFLLGMLMRHERVSIGFDWELAYCTTRLRRKRGHMTCPSPYQLGDYKKHHGNVARKTRRTGTLEPNGIGLASYQFKGKGFQAGDKRAKGCVKKCQWEILTLVKKGNQGKPEAAAAAAAERIANYPISVNTYSGAHPDRGHKPLDKNKNKRVRFGLDLNSNHHECQLCSTNPFDETPQKRSSGICQDRQSLERLPFKVFVLIEQPTIPIEMHTYGYWNPWDQCRINLMGNPFTPVTEGVAD